MVAACGVFTVYCRSLDSTFCVPGCSSKDAHLPFYPFRVHMNSCHNHPLEAGDVLRHRDVGPEARRTITKLLEMNHSPAAALDILKYDLQDEHPDDYILYAGDRYHCPDLQWCYRFITNAYLHCSQYCSTYIECFIGVHCEEKIQPNTPCLQHSA